jgi:hypothetical protein
MIDKGFPQHLIIVLKSYIYIRILHYVRKKFVKRRINRNKPGSEKEESIEINHGVKEGCPL